MKIKDYIVNKELKVGDSVSKVKGYKYDGVIVAKFETLAGKERLVVDNRDGMLHIFNESQLIIANK